ncbi:serine protease [Sediminicoccus sp. KRV36]|uniref:S1C family serine protease n=1 Tax=Sediminicoccus sp. KRV36 TaxID=3133721 RepID=UPI002010AD5C|nr:serine protease [Sediminicoccus rosea]UPY38942.1 serine protease [Sediminicoccus rosea]
MAEPLFIGKVEFSAAEPVNLGGTPVIRLHGELVVILNELRAGAAARMFAEPVVGSSAVSLYAEGSGDPQRFTSLSPTRRAEAEAVLRARLTELLPALDHPTAGPLLRRALCVGIDDGLYALDDGVVIVGWGMVPAGGPQDEAAITDRVRAVFARFSPALATAGEGWLSGRPLTAPPPPPAASARPTAVASPRPAAAPIAAPVGASGIAVPPKPRPATSALWLVPLLVAVGAIFLLLGAWLAFLHMSREVARQPSTVSLLDERATNEAIRLQQESNRALEAELERARRAAAQPEVCAAEGPLSLPPAPERQRIQPEAVPQPVPQQQGQAPQPFNGSLAQLLERGVVMVVTSGQRGVGHGTGFFVSGDTIVTNSHVVEGADPAQVFITSASIGRVIPARIVARTRGAGGGAVEPGELDLAVLKLDQPVPGAQPLGFTRTAERLTDVVAAGYPASVVQVEQGMQELRQGRLQTPPEIVLTRGTISTFQTLGNNYTIMPHTADMSPGNSGGPLVDLCGRVVGINTFISRATAVADRVKYAQKTDSLLAWLQQNGVAADVRDGACQPALPGLPFQPPAATPAAPAPPAPIPPAAAPPAAAPPAAAPPAATPPAAIPPASAGPR